jgi:sugar lactone lactonase YvrE
MTALGPAVVCAGRRAVLGEGVRWDARRGELLRVDITEGLLVRERPGPDGDLHEVGVLRVDVPLAAVAPVAGHDGWAVLAGRGFAHLSSDGALTPLAEVAPRGARMNDGACDPQGRLWGGTTSPPGDPAGASLHRLDADGTAHPVLDGLGMANGIGWSPDGTTMYLVDSGPRTVTARPFDGARGEVGEGRVIVRLGEGEGVPDGMTVDAEGALWVAVFGAGEVRRYAPDGTPLGRVAVPAPQVTCCWFGGPRLDTLYVTTATEGYDDARRAAEPLSGRVFRVPGAGRGRPVQPFDPAAPPPGA